MIGHDRWQLASVAITASGPALLKRRVMANQTVKEGH
jgi:hypothetical protein